MAGIPLRWYKWRNFNEEIINWGGAELREPTQEFEIPKTSKSGEQLLREKGRECCSQKPVRTRAVGGGPAQLEM